MRRINSRIVREATKKVQAQRKQAGAAAATGKQGAEPSADGSSSIPVSTRSNPGLK